MATVILEFPENALAALRWTADEAAGEMRLAAAAAWYRQGKVSQEIAVRIAGMNRTDFLLALARMGQDSFHVDFADLDRELDRG